MRKSFGEVLVVFSVQIIIACGLLLSGCIEEEKKQPNLWGTGETIAGNPVEISVRGRPSYSIYEPKIMVLSNDPNDLLDTYIPYPPGPYTPLKECNHCNKSFGGMSEAERWRHGDVCPGLPVVDMTPIWGNGELPVQWTEYFGTDNGARMDFRQSQIINELIVRVRTLEINQYIPDPNGVK